jgi:hypothetical protein
MPTAIKTWCMQEDGDGARPKGREKQTWQNKVYHGYTTVAFPGPFDICSKALSGERAKQAEQEWVAWFTSAD